jgi:hypothetical protein
MLPRRLHENSRRQHEGKRFPSHTKWVRGHRCSVPNCLGIPIEAAHVRSGTGGSMAVKPHDKWVISLCRDHHSEQHRIGETSFALKYGINLIAKAEEFAARSPHRFKWMEKFDDA